MYDLGIDSRSVAQEAQAFIRDQVEALERDGIIVGVSGGIDSAVSVTLAVRALGPERVLGLLLPERDSSPHSTEDGRLLMDHMGAAYEVIDITPTLKELGIYRKAPIRLLVNRRVKAEAVRATLKLYQRRLGENPFVTGLKGEPVGARANASSTQATRMPGRSTACAWSRSTSAPSWRTA